MKSIGFKIGSKYIQLSIGWYSGQSWYLIPTIAVDFRYKFIEVKWLKIQAGLDF